jgi:hypothetical protein
VSGLQFVPADIRATPGFAGASWPRQISPAENLRDLEHHAQDFIARRGFTCTVLSTATGEGLPAAPMSIRREPRIATVTSFQPASSFW